MFCDAKYVESFRVDKNLERGACGMLNKQQCLSMLCMQKGLKMLSMQKCWENVCVHRKVKSCDAS